LPDKPDKPIICPGRGATRKRNATGRRDGIITYDLGGDFFQELQKARTVAGADDPLEVALVLPRAAGHDGQRLLAVSAQIEAVCASVMACTPALDQAAAHQILDDGRKA
jgi:hypothetical protein